jgi:hypothetical protein
MRRIIGCTLISALILLRACVLEAHPPPVAIESYLIMGAWFLTPIAFLLSVLTFLFLGLFRKINLGEQTFAFLCSTIGWALGGIGIASLIVIAISAYYQSPQGPFSIIFLDGPLGAGVGTIVGFVIWLSKVIRGEE